MILTAVFLAVGPAGAAVIYLFDGRQIEGTVVSATANDVQINTSSGLLRVPASTISRIDYQGAPAATTQPADAPYLSSRAEPVEPERQMFSFDIGIAAPVSDVRYADSGGSSSNNGSAGFLLGTQYVYYTTPQMGYGLNIEYFHRGGSDSSSLLPAADTSVFGDTLLLMLIGRYSITNRGGTRPYILAGIGGNRTSTEIDARPVSGFVWSDTDTDETRRVTDDTQWGMAGTLRLGIDFYYAEPALFSFEIGWTGLWNDRYGPTQAGRDLGLGSVTGNMSALTFAGRWGWKF